MALQIYDTPKRHIFRNVVLVLILVSILVAVAWYGYKWYTSGEQPPVSLPVVGATHSVDESAVNEEDITNFTVANDAPRFLTVPGLRVEIKRIIPVGFDDNQVLQLPSNINDIGWYNKSGTPGSNKVIVMTAHGSGIRSSGPLANAAVLQAGDIIRIERGDGDIFTYKIVDVTTYGVEEFNSKISVSLGTPVVKDIEGVNIIITTGKWVPLFGTYDTRTLMRASLVD